MEGADRLVRRAIEIAGFYECPLFLESPVGRLRGRCVVSTLYLCSVDYGQYKDGRFAATYNKPTCIWTNTSWIPQRALCNRWTCQSCENGLHRSHAQTLSTVAGEGSLIYPQRQLFQIPPALIDDICDFVTSQLRDAPSAAQAHKEMAMRASLVLAIVQRHPAFKPRTLAGGVCLGVWGV